MSLDPQGNFHKHVLYQKQNQIPSISSHVEGEEEEEQEGRQQNSQIRHQQPPSATTVSSAGEILRRSQFLKGRLDPYHHQTLPEVAAPPQPLEKRSYFSSPLSLEPTAEHARLCQNMAPTQSRKRLRNTGGEIVEVQGGHIVRSTDRKDRHSKVCTAMGPRDRRVRLAAHTAIQFYDVQDRLGYDRPSKAVDWLIKKAKAAIDELAQLPATTYSARNANFEQEEQNHEHQPHLGINANLLITSNNENNNNPSAHSSSFLPPSLDSDSIADTIKSFFPIEASVESTSSAMEFETFPSPDLLSRNSNNTKNQDLNLSLQSFQDPILLHHQTHQNPATQLGFDRWADHYHQQHQTAVLTRCQRPPVWHAGGESTVGSTATGYPFNFPAATQQQLSSQNQVLSQRGPLQSSNTPTVRAWMDPSSAIHTLDESQHHHYQQHPSVCPIYQSSIGIGGFSGFRVPARIQGDEEENNGYTTDKPSPASSDPRH